jgi:hypothetical protein
MGNKKSEEQRTECPLDRFFRELEDVMGKKSAFFEHMSRSRIEFLKGIRSLLDDRIQYYEKKGSKKSRQKMTKIRVE